VVRISLALITLLTLNGCAAYTAVSMTSYATTSKSPTDHLATELTGGDCSLIKNVYKGLYPCEMPVVYNSSAY
jgi:hypothetical protein